MKEILEARLALIEKLGPDHIPAYVGEEDGWYIFSYRYTGIYSYKDGKIINGRPEQNSE